MDIWFILPCFLALWEFTWGVRGKMTLEDYCALLRSRRLYGAALIPGGILLAVLALWLWKDMALAASGGVLFLAGCIGTALSFWSKK